MVNKVSSKGIFWTRLLFFVLSWLALLILYAPAEKGGFYADFTGLILSFKQDTFAQFINRSGPGYDIKSLYQVTQFLYYILLKLFGTNTTPWYLLFTALQAATGLTLYIFTHSLCQFWNLQKSKYVAIAAAILFLFNPITTEVVVWKACLHYFNALISIFLILNWLLKYFKTTQYKYIIYTAILYLFTVFTLELFYLTPVFVFIIILFAWYAQKINKQTAIKCLALFWSCICLIWCFHIFIYHNTYHMWVAHRTERENVLPLFNPLLVASKWSQYFTRVFCFDYLLPFGKRTKMYHIFQTLPWQIFVLTSLFAGLLFSLLKFRKMNGGWQLFILSFILTIASTIVILPNWFNDLMPYFNDRYFYLLWALGAISICFLLHAIWNGRKLIFKGIIWSAYLFLGIIVNIKTISKIHYSATIFWSLIETFRWKDPNQTVYILNGPVVYNGYCVYSLNTENGWEEYLAAFDNATKSKVYVVAGYNINSPAERPFVTMLNANTIKVELSEWGSWWWNGGLGAANYEKPMYKFELNEPSNTGAAYRMTFTRPIQPDKDIFLVQYGTEWKRINPQVIDKMQK